LANIPVILYTPHGHIFYGYFNLFLTKIFIVLEKFAAKFTDKIITLTEKGKEEWVSFGIASQDKFIAIPSGIRFSSFCQKPFDFFEKKRELNIPGNVKVIASVGRLVPVKGHKYFISSMPKIINFFPDACFILFGDGPLKEELKKQTRFLGIEDKVKFLGWRADLSEILQIADILVFPSLNEGMGRAIVEAMALAKPVVATKVGGIPDVIIDNYTGLLFPAQDEDALANQVIRLLKDNALAKQLGLQAKEHVLGRFDVKKMIDAIQGLYQTCLKNKGYI